MYKAFHSHNARENACRKNYIYIVMLNCLKKFGLRIGRKQGLFLPKTFRVRISQLQKAPGQFNGNLVPEVFKQP